MNDILLRTEIKDRLFKELSMARNDVLIISAYCKENVVDELERHINREVHNKILLVRFQYYDITTGASDLSIYEKCKLYGWQMYLKLDLHVKTYVFDKCRCIIGSANATNKGLGLTDKANDELAAIQELDEENYNKIFSLVDDAVPMTDSLYDLMRDAISKHRIEASIPTNWPQAILDEFDPEVSILFSEELPDAKPEMGRYYDFIDNKLENYDQIKKLFCKSKCYSWLKQAIAKKDIKEIYYGELSVLLHNALISDPPAYRKEIKTWLSNIIAWVEFYCADTMQVDRPNYSQRIRLI